MIAAGSRPPAERLERFRAWLEAFAEALERADGPAIERAFAIESTCLPGPFAAPLRGRAAIRDHLLARVGRAPGLSVAAEVLGVGATYGVAHWRLTWAGAPSAPAGPAAPAEDGVLLVALDVTGRCTALREWVAAGEVGPG